MPAKVVKPEVKHLCLPRWRGIIARARDRGRFTESNKGKAGDWDTCAIGEATERYTFQFRSRCKLLEFMGMDFYHAVEDDDFNKADKVLTRIEKQLTKETAHVSS